MYYWGIYVRMSLGQKGSGEGVRSPRCAPARSDEVPPQRRPVSAAVCGDSEEPYPHLALRPAYTHTHQNICCISVTAKMAQKLITLFSFEKRSRSILFADAMNAMTF